MIGPAFVIALILVIAKVVFDYAKRRRLVKSKNGTRDTHDPTSTPGPRPPVILDTKKCPSCAEDIRLEASVCQFCGYKFTEAEVAQAAQDAQAAQMRAAALSAQQAELAKQQQRNTKLLRKGRTCLVAGWILSIPSSIWFLCTLIVAFLPSTPRISDVYALHLLAWLFFWILFSVPLFVSVLLIRKGKSLKRQATK